MSAFFGLEIVFVKLETKTQASKYFTLHEEVAINFYRAATIAEDGGIIIV